eukprot:8976263-Pyramimonas_sp.AAC.1
MPPTGVHGPPTPPGRKDNRGHAQPPRLRPGGAGSPPAPAGHGEDPYRAIAASWRPQSSDQRGPKSDRGRWKS